MTSATNWNPCAGWLEWWRKRKRRAAAIDNLVKESQAAYEERERARKRRMKAWSGAPENTCYDDGETWRHGEIDRECGPNDG